MKSVPFILTALLLLTVLMGCETSTGPIENDLSSGKGVNNTDAAPVEYFSISGTVFFDIDGDGVLDDGEPGIPGIDVTLDGVRVVPSGGDGSYSFDNLLNGQYTVVVDDVPDYSPTTPQSRIETINNQSIEDVDFGFVPEEPPDEYEPYDNSCWLSEHLFDRDNWRGYIDWHPVEGPQEFNFYQGRGEYRRGEACGKLTVWIEGEDLKVKFETETLSPYKMILTQLHIASSYDGFPFHHRNIVPGDFDYQTTHDPAVTEFTYTINNPPGGTLYIAAHMDI